MEEEEAVARLEKEAMLQADAEAARKTSETDVKQLQDEKQLQAVVRKEDESEGEGEGAEEQGEEEGQVPLLVPQQHQTLFSVPWSFVFGQDHQQQQQQHSKRKVYERDREGEGDEEEGEEEVEEVPLLCEEEEEEVPLLGESQDAESRESQQLPVVEDLMKKPLTERAARESPRELPRVPPPSYDEAMRMINPYPDEADKLEKRQEEEHQEEEQQKLDAEKNLVITAAEKNLVMTDSCAAEAKVGSLVPSEWVQESEFSASKTGEEVVVGDLVVVMRSDGSMRFGEIMALNSALNSESVCQVIVGKSSEGSLLVKEVVVSSLYRLR
jgi:hypothetical protein